MMRQVNKPYALLAAAIIFAIGLSACNDEYDMSTGINSSVAGQNSGSSSNEAAQPATQPTSTQPTSSAPPKSSFQGSPVEGLLLRWSAPQRYTNYTYLDPDKDLDVYEIFVNKNGRFNASDQPVATVFATDARGRDVESCSLKDLDYNFSFNQTYYFSMRSVAKTGAVSAFTQSLSLKL